MTPRPVGHGWPRAYTLAHRIDLTIIGAGLLIGTAIGVRAGRAWSEYLDRLDEVGCVPDHWNEGDA
jgi:hypothetical protein